MHIRTQRNRWQFGRRLAAGPWLPWLVLAASLTATLGLWHWTNKSNRDLAQARMELRGEIVGSRIRERMRDSEQMLRGCVGLFQSVSEVERETWHTYLQSLDLKTLYPGVEGVGFAQRVPAVGLAAHEARLRTEGFPSYQVHPAGARPEYFPVIYLEPFSGRNLRAFGYDTWADPTRRAAMERARDRAEASVTGKVILAQEGPEQPIQDGFLLYLPVYRNGCPQQTLEHRQEALLGFVYTPFRAGDFVDAFLVPEHLGVSLEIYDGPEVNPQRRLYNSAESPHTDKAPPGHRALFRHSFQIDAYGHTWTAVIESLPALEGLLESSKPRALLPGGLLLSVLLSGLAFAHAGRQRAEQALRRANQEWARTFDSVPDLITILDEHHRIVRVNRAMAQRLGKSPAECHGAFCFQVFHQLEAPPADCPQRCAWWQAQPHMTETRGDFLDSDFLISTTPLRDEHGASLGLVHVARDITQLKRAQAELRQAKEELEVRVQERTAELARANEQMRESEERFRTLFEWCPTGCMLVDPADAAILDCNELAARALGYSREELRRLRVTDYEAKETAEQIRAKQAAVLAGKPAQFDTVFRTKSGELRDFHVSVVGVQVQGWPLLYAGVLDVTERKRFEDRLEQLVAERTRSLQETTAQLNAFCYSIAHDLKAPIRAQVSFAQILLAQCGAGLGELGRMCAERIAEAAERQGKLVSDLLAHTSLGRTDLPLEAVPLDRAVESVRADLQMDILQKQAVVELGPLPHRVQANASSLHLIILNLMSNALKFVPRGSAPQVCIWAEPVGSTPGAKPGAEPGSTPGWVRLWVEDNGIGLPLSSREKLFGVFQRLHPQEDYPGTGMGLAIVKRAAERMGGRVGVESSPGQGSRFWLELRRAAGADN